MELALIISGFWLSRKTNNQEKETMEVTEVTETKPDELVDIGKATEDLKKKYPGTRLFHAHAPYVGSFVFRQQTMADVKASTEAVDKFVEKKIADMGGHEVVDKLPLEERTRIARETDAEAGDISNLMALKSCVLFPEGFAEDVDSDRVVSGVVPMLLEKIMEISGWTDVEVREV
jgi:hypothetical protein